MLLAVVMVLNPNLASKISYERILNSAYQILSTHRFL